MKFRKGREIAWGLLLLGGAALLILSQMGFELTLGQFSWIQIIILIGCVWFAISGLIDMHFYGLTFGLGIGYVVLDGPMGWPEIDLWIVCLAAVLAGLGLHTIFRGKRHRGIEVHIGDKEYVFNGDRDETEEAEYREVVDEDSPRQSNYEGKNYYGKEVVFANKTIYTGESENITGEYVFSGVNVYVEGQRVRSLGCDVVFSGVRVYFDKAALCNGYAEINTDVVFSKLSLYVPREWNVVDQTGRVFGRQSTQVETYKEGAPTLCIKGDCVFGSIHVKRI